jgi:hypothetical protein
LVFEGIVGLTDDPAVIVYAMAQQSGGWVTFDPSAPGHNPWPYETLNIIVDCILGLSHCDRVERMSR